jgi:hypothetical protein
MIFVVEGEPHRSTVKFRRYIRCQEIRAVRVASRVENFRPEMDGWCHLVTGVLAIRPYGVPHRVMDIDRIHYAVLQRKILFNRWSARIFWNGLDEFQFHIDSYVQPSVTLRTVRIKV